MMPSILLGGCSPEPLSGYLKALAVLRLVSEQADASATGRWDHKGFQLNCCLDQAGLVRFFTERYSPSPIVAPWNGGSGFCENDRKDGLDALLKSADARFADYRSTIESIQRFSEMPKAGLAIRELLRTYKEDTEGKRGKSKSDQQSIITEAEAAAKLLANTLSCADIGALTYDEIAAAIKSGKTPPSSNKKEVSSAVGTVKKLRNKVSKLFRSAGKEEIILAARSRLGDRAVEWIDAAVVISSDGSPLYPPLSGTGGCEGKLEYTNTFMLLIKDLLVNPPEDSQAEQLLKAALFGGAVSGLVYSSFGQYNPGRSGGYNMGPGVEDKDFTINPWDFVFTLEGLIAWAAGLSRRLGSAAKSVLVSPFTVRTRAVGYSSASATDPNKARAEVWLPLWDRPTTYPEIRNLIGEGRAEIAGRRSRDALEFAEAASSLGVDRGITGFARYSLLKRRGDSYLALSTGRFAVKERREAELVRELETVLRPVDSFFYKFPNHEPPAQLASARRGIDEAIFNLLARGGRALVRDLVASLGRMERLLAVRDVSRKPKMEAPLGGLRSEWVLSADDGSVEVRLAAALAAMRPTGGVGPLRANLAPIDPTAPWKWSSGGKQVAWSGPSLPARMVDALIRRTMDADRLGAKGNPLFSPLTLHEQDIAAFLFGAVDENLVEDLLFGFSWIKWHDTLAVNRVSRALAWKNAVSGGYLVPREWALLKLLFLPGPLIWPPGKETTIKPEPSVVPLLVAGRLGRACAIAQRRLFSAGLNPVRTDFLESEQSLRTACSLLFPVRRPERIARLVLHDVKSS